MRFFKTITMLFVSVLGLQIDAASPPEFILAQISTLPTSGIDREIFDTLNSYRITPSLAVTDLKALKSYFITYKKNPLFLSVKNEALLLTNEGSPAYDEAIAFMTSLMSLSALKWNDKLASAAAYHTTDIGPKGLITHNDSDGKNSTRVFKGT